MPPPAPRGTAPAVGVICVVALLLSCSVDVACASVLPSCGCGKPARKPIVLANGTIVEPPDEHDDDDWDDGSSSCHEEVGPPLDMQVVSLTGLPAALLGSNLTGAATGAESPPFPFRLPEDQVFFLDRAEVTNDRFAAFWQTGYRTEAETRGEEFTWRFPQGSSGGSPVFLSGRGDHPVVRVTLSDALAFCAWAAKHETKRLHPAGSGSLPPASHWAGRLPSEDEWELAASSSSSSSPSSSSSGSAARYPWGDSVVPDAMSSDSGIKRNPRHRANLLQTTTLEDGGTIDAGLDRFKGTAPISAYGSQNALGLHHVVGNAREWTASPWCAAYGNGGEVTRGLHMLERVKGLLLQEAPTGPSRGWRPSNRTGVPQECSLEAAYQTAQRAVEQGDAGQLEFVVKGGSYRCDPSSTSACGGARPAARQTMAAGATDEDLGFRCLYVAEAAPTADKAAATNIETEGHQFERVNIDFQGRLG